MDIINYAQLEASKADIKRYWESCKPFSYFVYDDFFYSQAAENILLAYPNVVKEGWSYTTYINQNNKFVKTEFEEGSMLKQTFDEMNSPRFTRIIEEVTGIENIIPDHELFGGGLHQSLTGAFLDVHVDFNYHPKTNYHRRLNAIVYMNKDWKPEYNGYLELWDMKLKKQLEYIEPKFNRCVVFETNEVSYHGHPKPLKLPPDVTRKSIALYYYTVNRPNGEVAKEHNTIYVNTEGTKGKFKSMRTGFKALIERIKK